MALPDEYRAALRKTEFLAALRADVVSHEGRIAQLRDEVRLAEEEIAVHEVILELARNQRLIALVGDLYDDSALTSTFASDPLRYCQEENIPLPDGVTLSPVDTEGPSPRIMARVTRGTSDVEIVWERESGFLVRPYVETEALARAR
jgi:hypothetical protein